MYAYQPVLRRPSYAPRYQPPAVAQTKASLGQALSPSERGLVIAGGLLGTAISAGVAWVGIATGMREKGFLSALGWGVGVLFGLRSVITLGTTALVGTGLLSAASTPKVDVPLS